MADEIPGWERWLARWATRAEGRFDVVRERLGRRFASADEIVIVPYRSWGTRRELVVRGRVLQDPELGAPEPGDSAWENVVNMYRRFESDELPGVRVVARCDDAVAEGVTDAEGYFDIVLPVHGLPEDRLWHPVGLHVPEPPHGPPLDAVAHVMVPARGAERVIVSDLDDTVVQTGATRVLEMVRNVFLANAHTRVPFPGVAAFYAALHEGRADRPVNPIFYVSSSPWNLYDLLADFMEIQGIPHGPIVLRDWGISEDELLPTRHRGHKTAAIRRLLETYADLPFVLVGDSGQHDPEIYAELVTAFPGRITTVYIRDVVKDRSRTEAMVALAEQVLKTASRLVVVDDTLGAARDAVEQGYVEPEALLAVEGRRVADVDPAAVPADQPPLATSATPTVVIAPSRPAAARAAVDAGVVADALARRPAQHADGKAASNVVVESPDHPPPR